LNGINTIRLDINSSRYPSTNLKGRRIAAPAELKTATESEKKKQFYTEYDSETDSKRSHTVLRSERLLSDAKYYRANLLSEIVNKMSGLEKSTQPGRYVEYFA
jgi:hypothetical protein